MRLVPTAIKTNKIVNTLANIADQKPNEIAVCRVMGELSVAFIFNLHF
ncbi:hypothetical protein APA_469 [Pseudanabaena sp. lw0831]|nr:hypothetical protein APA_469 [Pseudanabaena sp. lw0831]